MKRELNSDTPILEKCNFGKSQKLMQYVASISVSLGALCAGTVLAWTSPALGELGLPTNVSNIEEYLASHNLDFVLSKKEEALVGSTVTIGALIAAIPSGIFADKFGRKLVILILASCFMMNWILILFAKNSATLIIARLFAGLGLGGICVTAPMYIGEIAENSMRGILASFFQMFLCLGILLTFIIGTFANYITLSGLLLIVPIIFAVSFYFMPETHVHLAKKGKIGKAEESLKKFRGQNFGYDIHGELKVIQQEIQTSQEKTTSLREAVSSAANRKAVFAVVGVMAYQQLCGINAVVFYTVPIFKSAGSSLSPNLAAIIISTVQCIGAYISIFTIEKGGRKFFLLLSAVGMFLCLSSLAISFHLMKLEIKINGLGFIPLVSAVLFMISFTMGYGAVPWMLLHELLAPEIRGIASGIAVISNWFSAFLVTFFFPIMISDLGNHVTFYIFAGIISTSVLFTTYFVPETKGKTLLEIQASINK